MVARGRANLIVKIRTFFLSQSGAHRERCSLISVLVNVFRSLHISYSSKLNSFTGKLKVLFGPNYRLSQEHILLNKAPQRADGLSIASSISLDFLRDAAKRKENMTSLFPHPAHAEDQSYARTILYLHVVRASAMSFSFISIFRFPISLAAARYRKTPVDYHTIVARTLKTSGYGLVLGTAAGVAMTWGRMRGREEIEWKDRSWGLLENKGETKTDWATLFASGAGAVATLIATQRGIISLTAGNAVLSGAGLGSAAGVPYMFASFVMGRSRA